PVVCSRSRGAPHAAPMTITSRLRRTGRWRWPIQCRKGILVRRIRNGLVEPFPAQGLGASDMLDHVSIGVSDIERSKAFYDQALKPLGIERLYAEDGFGYGQDRKAFFWIGLREAVRTGSHIAFAAKDRAAVDAFH